MYAALESGFAQAADLAEYLMVTAGLDYRSAYDLVGVCVRRAEAAGSARGRLTGEMLDAAAAEAGIDRPAVAAWIWPPCSTRRDRAVAALPRWRGPGVVRGMAAECAGSAERPSPTSRRGRAGTRPTCGGRPACLAAGNSTDEDGGDGHP